MVLKVMSKMYMSNLDVIVVAVSAAFRNRIHVTLMPVVHYN